MAIFILTFLILTLALGYSIYAEQYIMGVSVVVYYALGIILLRLLTTSTRRDVYNLYGIFFLIYGSLVLFTHIELIQDPYNDYFIHNDAAWSFYSGIINYAVPKDWTEIFKSSLLNPMFDDFPLASLLFAVIAKIGIVIGVLNLRLFLRIHVVVIGAMIVGLCSDLLYKYGYSKKRVYTLLIPFGLCSFLYISSAIFSRDIHVTFVYSLVGYLMLLPGKKKKELGLIVLAILAAGLRPVNGILLLIPLFLYFYEKIQHKYKNMKVLLCLILFGTILTFGSSMIDYGMEKLQYYEGLTSSNTGGVFQKVYNLPFPINQIGLTVYMLLMPLPIDMYVNPIYGGNSAFTLPFVLSPFIMSLVFIACLWFIWKKRKVSRPMTMYLLCAICLFVLIIYGSPDLRRAFAAIPMLYMGFCLVYDEIPKSVFNTVRYVVWPTIVVIEIFFLVYLR
ncbi:MAG: hypothetical protein IJE43_11305 [Alphaproteobacteria bacterium]|nr:hypothetical protein [Alphaproteobacteria bacterium]